MILGDRLEVYGLESKSKPWFARPGVTANYDTDERGTD